MTINSLPLPSLKFPLSFPFLCTFYWRSPVRFLLFAPFILILPLSQLFTPLLPESLAQTFNAPPRSVSAAVDPQRLRGGVSSYINVLSGKCVCKLQIVYAYLVSRGFAPDPIGALPLNLARKLPFRKTSVPIQP